MAEYGLYGAMVRHSLPLPPHLTPSTAPWLLGMHKKAKLAEENKVTSPQDSTGDVEESEEDRRSNSIASLRKRAMEHLHNSLMQDHEVSLTIKKERDERCDSPTSPALSI